MAFDRGVPQFRRDVCPEYKAQRAEKRSPEDEEMRKAYTAQIAVAHRLFNPLGVQTAEAAGWEADDVIAALALDLLITKDVIIFSSDRDYTQLVLADMRIRFWDCGKSKWVDPDRYFCLKRCLDPKASDNLDGVPGIGPVKADSLLEAYASAQEGAVNSERFLAWCKERKGEDKIGKLCDRVCENAQKVRANWLCTHMPAIAPKCADDVRVRSCKPERSRFENQLRKFSMRGILEEMSSFWPPFATLREPL